MSDHRDPELDALLGEHSAEAPPAHLDAKILAAAHRAVNSGPRPALATQPWRWWMPLAAAAAIGLIVVGVLPLAPSIVGEPPHVVTDVPAEASAGSASRAQFDFSRIPNSAKEAAAPTQPDAAPAAEAKIARKSTTGSSANVARPASKREQSPAKRDESRQDRGIDAPTDVRKQAGTAALLAAPQSPPAPASGYAAPPVSTPLGATAPQRGVSADARDKAAARPHTVDEWIARIRMLRNRGDVGEATRALADFRAAFSDADARLPSDLREWADATR